MIETQSVAKTYGRGMYALRDLNLKIDKGEFASAKQLLLSTEFQKVHQTYSRTGLWRQICGKLPPCEPLPKQLGEDQLARFAAYRENLMPRLQELPGFCSLSMMVDRRAGQVSDGVEVEIVGPHRRQSEHRQPDVLAAVRRRLARRAHR